MTVRTGRKALYCFWAPARTERCAGEAIARRVRQETSVSLKWIAERLAMGTWTYVSNLVRKRAEVSPA